MRKVLQLPRSIHRTSSTLAHHSNPLLTHSSRQQLPAIRLPKIQIQLLLILSHTNPKKLLPILKPLSELPMHLPPTE